jgi:hypothetical protein
VDRIPGGAAQTYGIALTGGLAVSEGVCAPSSSSGTSIGSSTASGASPRTRTRHPVRPRSHAGSISVVQYQVGVMLTTASPPDRPTIAVRIAAIVPARSSPAAICTVRRASA